jgi:hypothetical protein
MCKYACTLVLLMEIAVGAGAGERWRSRRDEGPCDTCPPVSPYAQPSTAPGAPPTPPSDIAQPPSTPFNEALASAGEGGTQPAASYMPGFFGDLFGGCVLSQGSIIFPGEGSPFRENITVCTPDVATASAIKISDSDSPRPVDRIYYLYNLYGNVTVNALLPPMQVNRHTIGFEKTFLDGDASIGMRLPFFGLAGYPTFETAFTGDLTVITKYALINNRQTGNVLSFGLTVTAPTGGSPLLLTANGAANAPRSLTAYLQPYGGYIYNIFPRLYFQGFHSVLIPTDSAEPTFMANDLSLGFWLYRNPDDSLIRAIIPTVEIHVTTPFNHTEEVTTIGQVHMIDTVTLTTGVYALFPRAVVGGAVGIPMGDSFNRIEALASVTLRW